LREQARGMVLASARTAYGRSEAPHYICFVRKVAHDTCQKKKKTEIQLATYQLRM
jgi:hypothetical protein